VPDTGVPETTENTISVAELTVRDTITNGRKVIYTSESEITADNVGGRVAICRQLASVERGRYRLAVRLLARETADPVPRERDSFPRLKTRSLRTTRTRLCRSIPGMCSPIRSST